MVDNSSMPVTNEKKRPSEKLRLPSARRSTTGWAQVRLRQMKRMPERPDTHAQSRMLPSPNQSQRAPSSSTYSRHPRNRAMKAMPGQSASRGKTGLGRSMRTRSGTATAVKAPGTMLTKNSQCQE